ncbi:hypothetical protein WJX77_007803 [Trebouxia sp. C0004]
MYACAKTQVLVKVYGHGVMVITCSNPMWLDVRMIHQQMSKMRSDLPDGFHGFGDSSASSAAVAAGK